MLSRYGFEFEGKASGWGGSYGLDIQNGYNLAQMPFAMTRSGYEYEATGNIYNVGSYANCLTATSAGDVTSMYYSSLADGRIHPNAYALRYYAFSLRYYITNFELLNYLIVDRQRRK